MTQLAFFDCYGSHKCVQLETEEIMPKFRVWDSPAREPPLFYKFTLSEFEYFKIGFIGYEPLTLTLTNEYTCLGRPLYQCCSVDHLLSCP